MKQLSRAEKKETRETIRAGSKSFHAASLFLPKDVREAARSLYAFCRSSDDLVDLDNDDGTASARLKSRLDMIYGGRPDAHLCDKAFAAVVSDYAIPRTIPDALIEGFEWDEAGRIYESMDDLLDYAARVASTVGVMMALIMGQRERHTLARAADLGLAMQLTNIARDVGEDARNGRVYLPDHLLAHHGLTREGLVDDPRFSQPLANAVRDLLAQADHYYARAIRGVAGLPIGCRPAIRGAALIYQKIGREITNNDYNSVDQRAHTSKNSKIASMLYATFTPLLLKPVSSDPADRAVSFLVESAATSAPPRLKSVDDKIGRMVELMATARDRRMSLHTQPRSDDPEGGLV
ncbi:MAG: phytoene/squalene synthase family protein [Pseudomonadota bacterium]